MALTPYFWRGRRALVTGHTGFKGAWLILWLQSLGAKVTGLALAPDTEPSLFKLLSPSRGVDSLLGDMRDAATVRAAVERARPEVVFHLAAQSLVRRGYREPLATMATNVMGTVNILEAVRRAGHVRAVIVVTSDKCYENDDRSRPLAEADRLGGRDPYSSSKACQELVAHAWRRSFFADGETALATARAGNAIGGGDWGEDRVLPDVFRELSAGKPVRLRNPDATRPWQHVLEPLAGYLMMAEALIARGRDGIPPALNFGPDHSDVRPVRWVVEQILERWGGAVSWEPDAEPGPAEAEMLVLDASLAHETLGWRPRIELEQALDWTLEWYRGYYEAQNPRALTLAQIERYQRKLVGK